MFAFFRGIVQGVRARRLAEQWCSRFHAEEPVQGSWVCADEPTRIVMRVFCGRRDISTPPLSMLPPWNTCVIVAVDKATGAAEQITDDAPYRPVLR